jgi:CTP synthase
MNHRFRLNPTLLPALSDGGLRPAAWSSDGICEAVEGADGTGWCIGIQGHPELGTARQSARLFAAFVAAAARAGAA